MDRQEVQSIKTSRWSWWSMCVVLGAMIVTVGVLYMHKRDSFHRWAGGQQYGRIVRMGANVIVLAHVNGVQQVVYITPETKIFFGRQALSNAAVKIGDFAIVAGAERVGTSMQARTVRIFPSHQ